MPDEFKLEYRYTDWIILCQYAVQSCIIFLRYITFVVKCSTGG